MLTFVLAQGFHFPLPTYKSPSLLLSTIVPYILPSNTLGCNKSIHQSFKLLVPTPFFLLAYSIAICQTEQPFSAARVWSQSRKWKENFQCLLLHRIQRDRVKVIFQETPSSNIQCRGFSCVFMGKYTKIIQWYFTLNSIIDFI